MTYDLEHPEVTRALLTGYGRRYDEDVEDYCEEANDID